MPWPRKQEAAIFLHLKRTKGEKYARDYMRKHAKKKR